MAHTFQQALSDARTRYPQHAAYLHALCHAAEPLDDPPPDAVEWGRLTHDLATQDPDG